MSFAIYDLVDPRNQETFYVGLTDDVYARFLAHLRCDGSNPGKDARIQDLKSDNVLPVMRTLQKVETLEQGKKREAYWIKHFYDLGMPLTNQVMPLMQEGVIIVQQIASPEPQGPKLKAMMTLEEQREYILHQLNQGISRRKIHARVDGFIHPDTVNRIIEECMPKPEQPDNVTPMRKRSKSLATPKTVEDVPAEIRNQIENLYSERYDRTAIQKQLKISGESYWMIREVCNAYDQAQEA